MRSFSVFASVALLVTAVPLAPVVIATTAPAVENLQNGSLEGAPGAANGYELVYAARPAAVARSGQQSVDLGPAGATPQTWSALAQVTAYPRAAVPLAQLQDLSLYYSVPAAPGASVSLQTLLSLSSTGGATRDTCLVGAASDLAQTSGFVRLDMPLSTTFTVADGNCDVASGTATLAGLQADPAYAAATILRMHVQTLTVASPYPAASSVYVDDLSVLASSSPNVRIVGGPATNLCGGASFADVSAALPCAGPGATVLVAPGAYVGDLSIPAGVTVCSAAVGDAACHPAPATTTIRGSGCRPVTMDGDGAVLQGFTIEAPGCTQADQDGGPVDATLVAVHASDVQVLDSILQTTGAALKPGQSRHSAQAIFFDPARSGGVVDGVTIRNLESAKGPDGTCASAPCGVTGIGAQPGLTISDTTIDGAGVLAPFTAVRAADGLVLKDATVRLPTGSATGAPDSIGVAGCCSGVQILRTSFAAAQGAAAGTAYGVFASLGDATVADSAFDGLGQGVFFRSGAPGDSVTGSAFTNAGVGVTSYSTQTRVDGNSFDKVVNAIVVNDTATGDALRGNSFKTVTVALELLTGVHDTAIDATRNDWGKYTRAEIMTLVKDQGTGNSIDVSCYLNAAHDAQVCPPLVDFALPAPAHFSRPLAFNDASTPRGHPAKSWAWTFGDGGSSAVRNAIHAYGAPGVYAVTLTVTDTDGQASSTTKTLAVSNTAPTLAAVADATVAEGARVAVTLSGADADGDALAYSVSPLPPGASVQGRTFSWTPGFDQAGTHVLDAIASDGAGAAHRTFTVIVTDVPMPPTIQPIPATTMVELGAKDVTVRASDPDGTPISFALAIDAPAFASLTDRGDGTAVLRLAPGLGAAGAYSVGVVATSGGQDATRSLALTVVQKSAFTLAVVGSSAVGASGGKVVTLVARVTNTGPETDTIALLARSGHGWSLGALAPVTLPPGGDQLVTFTVTVPATGGTDAVTISGASLGDPSVKGAATWTIDATLHASVLPSQRALTVRQTPHGAFTLTWSDGSGVPGASAVATQDPDRGSGLLATSVSGATDADGAYAYSFENDPLARLPGFHTLVVVARLGALTATAETMYQESVN